MYSIPKYLRLSYMCFVSATSEFILNALADRTVRK